MELTLIPAARDRAKPLNITSWVQLEGLLNYETRLVPAKKSSLYQVAKLNLKLQFIYSSFIYSFSSFFFFRVTASKRRDGDLHDSSPALSEGGRT